MIIAIDGPAGVGKSTIAHMVAQRCGFYFLNSGNFYRAVAWSHLKRNKDPFDADSVLDTARSTDITVRNGRIHVDGQDVEDMLHVHGIDQCVAQVSVDPRLRVYVNSLLRKVAEGQDIVTEGRDVTTVVFPDADLKFYFDAQPEIRARRRFGQHPDEASYAQVLETLKKRDEIDKGKAFGGLKVSEDAIVLDTSHLTIEEVCERVLAAIFVRKNAFKQ
ncbi:(d)CMP kinase [Parasphaerochaeta coccoides]|uniref:Cytidylate kinase n=1 Tax=Parasphaerochaeta coccoides (strain ATCC BAA-1237 / DSM 17374 / SPN1) TaxID=760011 RepID=F4GK68_PARC1|nr:(d)CMP kinase [Parasphaerochaeta coccoides]AEC01840.1 Cytidylate kinase [Parasphaerochaeta coccoides DSM 17374]